MLLNVKPIGKSAVLRSLLLSAGAFLLLSVAGLSSSSGADDALFVRTQAELDRLWSGVLGCAESDDPFTIRNRFNDSGDFEDAGGGAVPAGASRDYSECGKRALRNASSRMLVDAVEGALREGGLALFEEGFRIDSSIGWTAGESVRGELDAVLPLWSNTGTEGTGRVLFLQPGAVFWSGQAEQERMDTNLGLVFRRSFSRELVGGVSVFYDRNLDRELERIGGGLDIQGGIFTGGLNYYHPLGGGWREGRVDYEERAQRGMDLRVGLATEDVRFDGSMGLWRFKGEEDEATKWRPSLGVDAGFRVLPGVFLEAGYEYHNKEDSLGSRWNMGLAFRFDLPGLQGSGFGSSGYTKPDLWRPVEREKRVLYEERLAVPRVELTTEEEDVRVAEGDTATITGVIAKPLKQDAALHLVMHSTSTATHGPDGDFTLGHRVFEGDAPPSGEMADCLALPCVVPLPAGTTMFEVSVNVLADETNEVDEHIDLRAEVPAAHAGVLRSSGTVRVTIGAHDNTIAFGEGSQAVVEEDGGTAEVVVDVHLPAPMPVVLNIAAVGGTATQDDYILPPSVTIPAGQSSGMVVLRGRDDREGEGSETVFLGLAAAEELPPGWVLQESATHRVTIMDDDLAIGFADIDREEAEPASGTTTFTVAVELTMSPEEEVTVPIAVAERSEDFVPADVSYAPSSLTFAAGTANLSQDVTFTVHADAIAEADEVVRFLVEDHDSHTEGANAFSVGQRSFTLTIPANDNVVQLSPLTGNSFEEGESISLALASDGNPAPDGGLPVTVTVTPRQVDPTASTLLGSASDEDVSFIAEQVIPAGQASVAFDIDIVDDVEAELVESFEISVAAGENFPSSWGSVVDVPDNFSISANDNTIGFAQSASRVIENVSGGVHNVAVNADLSLPMSAQSVTFNIASGGTATENTDYSLSGTTVTVNAGTESVNIPVTIVNDSDSDVGETIELVLSPSSGASLPAGWSFGITTHTVTIIDDEAPGGVFSFVRATPGPATLEPGSGTTTDFTVGINAVGRLPDNSLTLVVAVDKEGTTADAKDYTVVQTLSSIPVNGTTVADGVLTIDFSILPDDDTEDAETITLVLPTEQPGLAGTGWSVDAAGQTTHVITIPANDVPTTRTVTFSKAESFLTEGSDYSAGDANEARLTITPVPNEQINISVAVTGDMDAYDLSVISSSGGASYANGMVAFPANESSVTFTVTPQDDEDADDELVTATIGQLPSNYSYGVNRAWRVTINDTDAGNSVAFVPAVGQDTANEGETLEIPVRLSENATADLAFGWSVNTAGADDVDPASGEITIQAGSNSAILPITVKGSDGPEIDEEITVTLTDKDDTDDYDIHAERGTHTFTVPANENLVGFKEITGQTGIFGEADTNATRDVRISVSQPVENDTRISMVLSGTADPATDYTFEVKSPPTATYADDTLILPANEGEIDFTVTVVDDTDNNKDFADEDIVFTLGDPEGNLPTGWAIDASNDTHTLMIVDDDEPAANTMGFATNGVITGETVASDPCASFGPHNNCIAVVYQINPGISDADVKGMLSLTASDGSAADTDDIYIVAEGGDGSRLAATELVYQSTGGAGGGTEKTIYVYLVDDGIPEGTEVYTLTASGEPSTHTLVNSTFTITVTDDDTADVGFKESASTGMESTSNSSMFEIGLSAPAPAGGLSLGLTLDNTTGSPVYDVADESKASYAQGNGLLTVNEGEMSVTLVGSQDNDTDNLNNRYVFTLSEHNNSLPEGWMINANKDTHMVTFVDTNPLDSTIGWEKTSVAVREDDGLVVVNLKLTDAAGGGVPFTGAIPELTFMAGSSAASDFTIDVADAGTWTANTGSVVLTAGASYEDGLVGVNFHVTDDALEEGTQTHTFTLAGVRFPQGWKVDDGNSTLTFTVSDDDIPREGGNTVEFATASGTVNEFNRQAITTRVVIDRPSKDEMKFLLTAEAPDEGAAADGDDYGLTVNSPATYDAETGIVTVPAGTTGFDVSVAAEPDTEDDDFESVVFMLSEGEDAMLPDGWRIGEQSTFTVIIFDSDGTTRPTATLSQWPRDGANAGGLAQLSSTTEEGGTAFGAVYLTRAGPVLGGIPLVLTVKAGHEGDVTITNHEEERSAMPDSEVDGQYNFVVKGGDVKGSPNLAALFNIEVEDDDDNEPVEVIDISVSKGEGFPDGWTLRDDVVYRLTVPRDASDTGGEVGFAAEGPSVNRAVVIEGQNGIERVIEASAPAPRGGLSFTWKAAGTDVSDVISETSGTLTISEGRRRATFSFDILDNDDVSSEDAVITFTIEGSNLPGGWEALTDVHTMTVTDDDLPRTVGGNTVEFAHAAANIDEADEQSVATKVLIDRPHKAEMNLLLTADAPASGSAAQGSDYTFSVRSPASYDPDTGILTIPADTTAFEVEVAAVADADDDDFEAVALTLKESADSVTGAQLPEGWRIGERSSFTVTIFDEDGPARHPAATLSQWPRIGADAGRFAQLSSTTVEGGTASAAVVLTEGGPDPDGLHFVLKVEEGHEDDVTLADAGDGRSTLVPGRVRGEYLFHMTGGNSNLGAAFNVNVVDDDENEPVEVVDIFLSKGADFPSSWTVREDVSYRLTIPRDADDDGGTLGFAAEVPAPGGGTINAATVVEGQSGVVRVIEASAPAPADITLNWTATVATDPPSDAPPAPGDVISETSGMLTVYKSYRRAELSFDVTDNAIAGLVEPVVTFELTASGLPEGWTLARPTHVMTIRDDDVTRLGGNLVFFENAAANVNEDGLQKVSTRIRIDRPDNAEMRFLLARGGPATGAAAGEDDYTFSVKSPADYDPATDIVTVPPGTDGFGLEVAAHDDAVDDDSEAVVFTLLEATGAMLPEGWEIDGDRRRFTVTIIDDDGAEQQPSATLSRWHREGHDAGRFAQLSSTTAEGGTVQGAVYLTQAGPHPEGLNFLLTVEDGHALDVTLTDYGDNRSTLVASETTAGLYHFHMTGGRLGPYASPPPNLAALFNIHVQEDVARESEEVVDITLSAGENFPDGWTVRGDAVYRLTIPGEESNVRFRTATSSTGEGRSTHSVHVEVRPPASEDLTFTITHAGTVGPNTASSDDYSLDSNTLTIKAGESGGSITVNITDDDEIEADETIVLALSGKVPTGYRLDRSLHTLTIEDDDDNTVGFETASASVEEGEEMNLRIKFEDSTGAALASLDRNLPLSVLFDDGDDHDVTFTGHLTLLTPSSTLSDGVFEIAAPVLAVVDSEREVEETVTFTLKEGANFPDNFVIDFSADTFTLAIAANGHPEAGVIRFAETNMTFREPYAGEETGVPPEIRSVLASGCANSNQGNCIVYYFDLEITGVPEEPFDLIIDRYSEAKGHALGTSFYTHEWGHPTRHRITPEDARDGRTRVPIAIARDDDFEDTEYWGLELRPHGLPEGWRIERWDARVNILDSTGGQLWFVDNDEDNGVETFNHSIINEGETVKVRIVANHVEDIDTPLSVSIEGHTPGFFQGSHSDIIGAPYDVTVGRYKVWVDMEITARDDNIAEEDETYTLVLGQGFGWQDYHGRRIDPARSRYTFTIPANDGPIPLAEGVAQLSEWTLEGSRRGLFAQTSSTTAEGSVAQGAVVLNVSAPEPDGLNLVLKVEPGHEDDVFLTNAESARSSLAAGDVPGEYLFNIKSSRVNSVDNLAALFNIHVVDDALLEEAEEIEISLLPGSGVPRHWTVRGESLYRLTVPVDANDTDSHTIAWETQTSVLGEDNMDVADGTKVKILIDDPLATGAAVGVDLPDTIAVADVANGTYDADARTLTINAGVGEVTLTIVSTGNVTGHTLAVLKMAELAGTGVLPAGWSVSEGVHVVTIEDNDRILWFARSEWSVREGESGTVELRVWPPLISTDVSVPFLLVGDADAYRLPNLPSFARSTAEGEERNATATLASNRNMDADSIPITIEALEEADRFDDPVTVMIDEDSLPEGYTLGVPSVAKVTIIDNDKRVVTFVGEDGRTEENSGQAVSIELQISPPLGRGEFASIPLKVTGDADAYTLTVSGFELDGPTTSVAFLGPLSLGPFEPPPSSAPDSSTLTVTPLYNDNDLVFDLVTVEIDRDRLPPGFRLGNKSSWRVEIPDDQLRTISWAYPSATITEANAELASVDLQVRPRLPAGETYRVTILDYSQGGWYGVSKHIVALDATQTGIDGWHIYSYWVDNSDVRISWQGAQDGDSWSETFIATIQPPAGFKHGNHPTFTLTIFDDD